MLKFNLGHNTSSKIAKFRDPDGKADYVKVEFSDPKCCDLYYAYQAAQSKENRQKAATELDAARWNCFKRWSLANPFRVIYSPTDKGAA